MNAYRATGTRRWLHDAERALALHRRGRLGPHAGGIWWNTSHPYKAGEALASGTLLATLLYQQTHSASRSARRSRFLAWANTAGFSAADGLYAGSNLDPTPIDYIEGPLIYAQAVLCRLHRRPRRLRTRRAPEGHGARRASATCSTSPRSTTRSTCSGCWRCTRSTATATLYALAADNARNAQTRALDGQGLYLLSWNGDTLPAAVRAAGDAADAVRHHQPVRVAGGVPAARPEQAAVASSTRPRSGRSQTPRARRITRSKTRSGSSRLGGASRALAAHHVAGLHAPRGERALDRLGHLLRRDAALGGARRAPCPSPDHLAVHRLELGRDLTRSASARPLSQIGVATEPGSTSATCTCELCSSTRSESPIASIACLEAA